jgi:hypothetical protein
VSRNQRFAVLGLAVVVLVVAFVVARSGSDDGGSNSASTTSSTPTGATENAPTGDGHRRTTKPAAPAVPTVVVRNGKPVGGVERLTFKHNDRIVFVVSSDVADEVHFHGYDIAKDVKAGGSVRFNVKATIEGRFEVELEQRKQQIAEVEVRP